MNNFNTITITFIGGGNMARSLISGLIKQGMPPQNIQVVEPNESVANNLEHDFSITIHSNANPKILNVNFVILAVKPQIMKSVCENLTMHWGDSSATLLSIAAGISSMSVYSVRVSLIKL